MRKSVQVETLNNLDKSDDKKRNSVLSGVSANDI